jgi:aspartyl-tRNA(Asn)/glutamyl-tRNA(Gln) amidotransferase subunit A
MTPAMLGVADLARALARRELTARAVAEAHLERITALDGRLHAFVAVMGDEALAAAADADRALAAGTAGPLAGVPFVAKDIFAVRGHARGNGSSAYAGARPEPADATAVARLRAAGAVLLGVVHMHELAYGATGVNPALGTPTNPWAPGHVPGGSSSGSAVAVAGRLATVALGTDTGASIRLPAALCGVVGLKPTYGRTSRAGVTPLAWTLDHVGPIVRSVEDAALVLQVLAGHDPADPASARVAVPDYAAALARPPAKVRIGVPRELGRGELEPEVDGAFTAALDVFRATGARIVDVSLPSLPLSAPALGASILAEASAALLPLLGPRLAAVGIDTRVRLEVGRTIAGTHYLAAQRLRTRLYEEAREAFAAADLLALPVVPLVAPKIGELTVRVGSRDAGVEEALTRFTAPFNLTGLPALALPSGFGPTGLPTSLQLVAPPFAERRLLAAGHAYQSATDWHLREPQLD